MERILVIYLLAVNLFAFILYGIDKKRARNREWRISERALIGIAVIGGSVGAILGMHVSEEKERLFDRDAWAKQEDRHYQWLEDEHNGVKHRRPRRREKAAVEK